MIFIFLFFGRSAFGSDLRFREGGLGSKRERSPTFSLLISILIVSFFEGDFLEDLVGVGGDGGSAAVRALSRSCSLSSNSWSTSMRTLRKKVSEMETIKVTTLQTYRRCIRKLWRVFQVRASSLEQNLRSQHNLGLD